MIHIANKTYEVVVDHKNGWKPEAFKERYSEVLERYDYIVGDWGYNQLRLRGFFKEIHPKATKESSIATLQDYLNEYCNFGCAYFIIERIASKHQPADQSASEESLNELDEQEQVELDQQLQQEIKQELKQELKQEIKQEQAQAYQTRQQRHQQRQERQQEQQSNRQQRPNSSHRKHNHHSPKPQANNNSK